MDFVETEAGAPTVDGCHLLGGYATEGDFDF
jgi:hypothetical protein